MKGKWLPGCYPGEQRGEDLLGDDEPGDGHEASSNTPIKHLAPGVVQQVDPGTKPERKFMRANQVRPTQYPTPNVSNRFLRSLGIGVKTHTDRVGKSRWQQGCRNKSISTPAPFCPALKPELVRIAPTPLHSPPPESWGQMANA